MDRHHRRSAVRECYELCGVGEVSGEVSTKPVLDAYRVAETIFDRRSENLGYAQLPQSSTRVQGVYSLRCCARRAFIFYPYLEVHNTLSSTKLCKNKYLNVIINKYPKDRTSI